MPLLHWLTREEDIHRAARAPYRLLEEARELSHGPRHPGNAYSGRQPRRA